MKILLHLVYDRLDLATRSFGFGYPNLNDRTNIKQFFKILFFTIV